MTKDMRGINIAEGDIVVYPGHRNNSTWITIARVKWVYNGNAVETVPFMRNGEKINTAGKHFMVSNANRHVLVVQLPKLDENVVDMVLAFPPAEEAVDRVEFVSDLQQEEVAYA